MLEISARSFSSVIPIHFFTALLMVGIIYLVMPFVTWILLKKESSHDVTTWCAGGFLMGCGLAFLGLRPLVPEWVSYPLANFLLLLGTLARVQALRLMMGSRLQTSLIVQMSCIAIFVFEVIRHGPYDEALRFPFIISVYSLVFFSAAVIAWQFGTKNKSLSAYWIAGTSLFLAISLAARVIEFSLTESGASATQSTFTSAMVGIAALLVGLISHVAFAGVKLEQTRGRLEKLTGEYEGILRTSKDGFFVADTSANLINFNDSLCTILGRERHELSHLDILYPDGDPSAEEIIPRLIQSGFERFEVVHERTDGAQINLEVTVTYLPDEPGWLLGFVRDITIRKRFEVELERRVLARTSDLAVARAEAESANLVRTRFMANVSHEMRTPLQVIVGYAELGKGRYEKLPREQLGDFFKLILAAGQGMQKLIESLLYLAQESWNQHAAIEKSDLRLIVPEVLIGRSIEASRTGAAVPRPKIVFQNLAADIMIRGDETRLRQVIEHLIGNALRFSPADSSVSIIMQYPTDTDASGEQLSIQIVDEGCGVPDSEMLAIFEPFYESSRTASGAGGTGLGLALCKVIIQRHRGTLTVSNRPTGGAIFEIRLPLAW